MSILHPSDTKVTVDKLQRMTMRILQLTVPQQLLLLLVLSIPPSAQADNQTCDPTTEFSNYFLLEEAAITNNSVNREELYRVFFSPNLPSPKSVKVHYQVERCGKSQPYKILAHCNNNEIWYWMSSAVFFIIDPLVLDSHALHILSWYAPFRKQLQPELILIIPPIEDAKAFNLLQQFTMTVRHTYMCSTRSYIHRYSSIVSLVSWCFCMHIQCRWNTFTSFLFAAQSVCHWKQSEKRLGLCQTLLRWCNSINHEG